MSSSDPSETGLPSGWEIRHSKSRNLPYYFNSSSQESCWEPPAGTDTEKLKAYMATNHSEPLVPQDQQAGKIRASHLLVKHAQSRRPSSWKEVSLLSFNCLFTWREGKERKEIIGHAFLPRSTIQSDSIERVDLVLVTSICVFT